MDGSATEQRSGFAIDHMMLQGMLRSDAIAEADILAGLYDHAEVTVSMVNYEDSAAGTILLQRGWLGQVTLQDGVFKAELHSLSQQLTSTVGQLFSPGCRANLGDARCKIDLAPFIVTGTVNTIDDQVTFRDTNRNESDNYFRYGTVECTSGDNVGQVREVKHFYDTAFSLMLPFSYPLQVGDSYLAIPGCDKRLQTCREQYSNVVNFRGEPHVPGLDRIMETGATRNRV